MVAYDVVVVGAGFAGAIMAQQLHEAGKKVLLVDRRDHIGGNAYDYVNEHGVLVHKYGPHIFNANDQRIVDYLSRFTDWRPYEHRVLAHTRWGLVPVPVNRTTLEIAFGVELKTPGELGRLLDGIQEPNPHPENVEEAVVSQVGREIYEEIFRPYTEKMWGRPATELDASVVGRLKARTDRDDRYFTSKFQAMPKDGYTAMFERMLEGIDVVLGVEGVENSVSGNNVNHLVWTGPIDEAFGCCYGRLPWRSLEFEHRSFRAPDEASAQPVGVVNYPSGLYAATRVTEWRHLTGQPGEWTTLTSEYPRAEGEPFYPVPAPDSRALYAKYAELAKAEKNVTFVGRLARYQYLAMHQVVGQALKASRALVERL